MSVCVTEPTNVTQGHLTVFAGVTEPTKITQGHLTVFVCATESTKITQGPEDYQVVAGDAATFRCTATVDPTLELSIDWLADGVPINFDIEPRLAGAAAGRGRDGPGELKW